MIMKSNDKFDVLFIGAYRTGKGTVINALVGKVMMATRIAPCTAVIATVEYGENTNNVKVIYSDSTEPKNMSLEQFTKEFALSEEDWQYIADCGRIDRFANVSHVEMQSTDEIFADGLRLIDSPGLEEATARTKATNEFVPKANAIIFTLSATSLFSAAEKEYIAANFAGKNMRNVFFVINRIDNLTPGQLEASIIPSVRNGLADVFTDENGIFNEELYNKRVFFTNAYGALCARTGESYKIYMGRHTIDVGIDIEDTGFLEFENEFNNFQKNYIEHNKGVLKMAFVNQETKNKLNTIATSMREYSTLVDVPAAKGELGMGMSTEAKVFRENAKDVENGVFKVLVMGKFKNGKSTFINALVGKVMMAARATACTAVIATVEYGENTNNVKVLYSDSTEPKNMSLEQFTKEFALSEEDWQYIADCGRIDRFANVSHVEMQSTDEIFADGLRLIDSPGLEEATARTKATNEFVPKANAIIFTLSATSLFSAAEKEYIAANFAGKNMRNVFFVINRIDNLTPGQLEASIIPSVRNGLADVFTDENGIFNEELYNKRVFFTNAYGALCARTGEPYKIILGKTEVSANIKVEDTGMLDFEEALREFLNSPDRINATFNSTLQNMANTYQIAAKTVAEEKAVRSQSKEDREKNAKLAEEHLNEAVSEVERIRKTVKDTAGQIAKKVYLDLCSYVQNDIPREYASIATEEAKGMKFGMGKMVMLAGNTIFKREEEIKKIYKPFMDFIEGYIKTKLADWGERVPVLISGDLKDLEDELNDQFSDFDMKLEEATNLFAYGNTHAPSTKGMNWKTGLQNALALANWDISLAVENTAAGGMNWLDFAKRVGTQFGIDAAVTFFFGGPLLTVILPIEVFSAMLRAKRMSKDIIISLGNTAFESLKDRVNDLEVDFEEKIISNCVEKGEQIATTAINLVDEQQAKMNSLLSENEMSDSEAKAENDRADSTLAEMHNCIDIIYKELYGRVPTEAEFLNLAKNEKK